MFEVRETDEYAAWFERLSDRRAKSRIDARMRRLGMGHFGDFRPLGDGVCEIRIDSGPGYRLYFTRRDRDLVILLAGGDKSTQRRDVERAKRLARNL